MDSNEKLYDAVLRNKIKDVRKLLKAGASYLVLYDEAYNSLHIAVKDGNLNMVEVLLESNGSGVNITTKDGYYPLHIAILNGYYDLVRFLLKNGADINTKTHDGNTPLHIAVQTGNEKLVKFLLKLSPNIEALNNDGTSPLNLACELGHEIIAQKLIWANANVNLPDKNFEYPVHHAASFGLKDLMKTLIEVGVDVNAHDLENFTALHVAASLGYTKIVQQLLTANADVNARSQSLVTPLLEATINGRRDVVRLLLAAGANVNLTNLDGDYPILVAAELGFSEIIDEIISLFPSAAQLETPNDDGLTPLMAASGNGHEDVVKLLLFHGCRDGIYDRDGHNAFHYAAITGNYRILPYLFAVNSYDQINHQDKTGATPLFNAAERGHMESVRYLLLEACVDPQIPNNEGYLATHIADHNGFPDVSKFIREPSTSILRDIVCNVSQKAEVKNKIPIHSIQDDDSSISESKLNSNLENEKEIDEGEILECDCEWEMLGSSLRNSEDSRNGLNWKETKMFSEKEVEELVQERLKVMKQEMVLIQLKHMEEMEYMRNEVNRLNLSVLFYQEEYVPKDKTENSHTHNFKKGTDSNTEIQEYTEFEISFTKPDGSDLQLETEISLFEMTDLPSPLEDPPLLASTDPIIPVYDDTPHILEDPKPNHVPDSEENIDWQKIKLLIAKKPKEIEFELNTHCLEIITGANSMDLNSYCEFLVDKQAESKSASRQNSFLSQSIVSSSTTTWENYFLITISVLLLLISVSLLFFIRLKMMVLSRTN